LTEANDYNDLEKSMTLRKVLLVGALVVPALSVAQEPENNSPWAGMATLGYLATSGNTENSTLNTAVEVGYTAGKWEHIANAFAIYASENKTTTTEAYELGWKSERNLTEHDFLFGRVQWRKDRFGGFNTQLSETVGYGRRLIKTDTHVLNVEAGVGARQSELQDGTKLDETIFRGGAYYKWLLSEAAEFRQSLTTEAGSDNTYLESVSALSAKVWGDIAMVASFTVKHNTDVPALTEKTDTYTALSLEYAF
jgi:putative salt-induced outer membrane protein